MRMGQQFESCQLDFSMQERLTRQLAETLEMRPELHDLVLLAMAAVGRGGEGNQGQRIRDEILTVQSRNNAKVIQAGTAPAHIVKVLAFATLPIGGFCRSFWHLP